MRNDETLNQEENVQRSGMTAVNVVCAFCVVAYVVAAVFVFSTVSLTQISPVL